MKELDNLKKEVENCRKCELWKTATNSVFGEGNEDSDIMFIGEAPGYWEDKKAKPFVGKAGKLLDELFEYSGLKREEIYITNILKHRPSEMSGGEMQRVAIARALINDPEIILADEPTGNLDSKTGDKIIKILTDLNKKGKTVIIVTHDPDIAKISKHVFHLKDGKVIGG